MPSAAVLFCAPLVSESFEYWESFYSSGKLSVGWWFAQKLGFLRLTLPTFFEIETLGCLRETQLRLGFASKGCQMVLKESGLKFLARTQII